MSQETNESAAAQAVVVPRTDIFENGDEMVILCDMPGVMSDDVDVKVEKGELRLSGKMAKRSPLGRCIDKEYDIGRFERRFHIGPEIDFEKISAECCDGVVTLHLPRLESAKPKQVRVHHHA